MYLNIISNINHKSKRKSKKNEDFVDREESKKEDYSMLISNNGESYLYYSVFYGDLTNNWIKLNY